MLFFFCPIYVFIDRSVFYTPVTFALQGNELGPWGKINRLKAEYNRQPNQTGLSQLAKPCNGDYLYG
jgi:hypothetical protein